MGPSVDVLFVIIYTIDKNVFNLLNMCGIIQMFLLGLLISSVCSRNYVESHKYRRDVLDTNCIENLCSTVKNYPYAAIQRALAQENNKKYLVFFGDVISTSNRHVRSLVSGKTECKSNLMYPKQGLDVNDKWKMIVNVDKYNQNILIKRCQKYSCLANETEDNTTECVQHFSLKKLLVINENKTLSMENFLVPDDCSCKRIKK